MLKQSFDQGTVGLLCQTVWAKSWKGRIGKFHREGAIWVGNFAIWGIRIREEHLGRGNNVNTRTTEA